MTYEETLEYLRKLPIDGNGYILEPIKVDVLRVAIEALDRIVPEKVVRRTVNKGFNLPMPTCVEVCPCCGVDTPNPRSLERWELFCPDCGQAIDWSEGDESE